MAHSPFANPRKPGKIVATGMLIRPRGSLSLTGVGGRKIANLWQPKTDLSWLGNATPLSGSSRVDWNDGPLAFCQQMPEAQNRALLDLHVVRCGDGNLGMAKHSLGGNKPEAGVDLASEFLAQGVQWRP